MVSVHALRRARRTRCVDQREHIVGLGSRQIDASMSKSLPAPRCPRAPRPLGRLAVDDDHVLDAWQLLARLEYVREVLLLDDRDVGIGVGDDRTRSGSVRTSDRWKRASRPERHGSQIGDVELGRFDSMIADRVAAALRERREPASQRIDALAQLAPGDRFSVVDRAPRLRDRICRGRSTESLGDCGASTARPMVSMAVLNIHQVSGSLLARSVKTPLQRYNSRPAPVRCEREPFGAPVRRRTSRRLLAGELANAEARRWPGG